MLKQIIMLYFVTIMNSTSLSFIFGVANELKYSGKYNYKNNIDVDDETKTLKEHLEDKHNKIQDVNSSSGKDERNVLPCVYDVYKEKELFEKKIQLELLLSSVVTETMKLELIKNTKPSIQTAIIDESSKLMNSFLCSDW